MKLTQITADAADASVIRRMFSMAPVLSNFSATPQEKVVVTLNELMH
jgi:hypothetical protein